MSLKSSWINLLYKTATGTKHVRTILTPIGVLFFGIFVLVFIYVAIEFDKFFKLSLIIKYPLNLYLGLLLTISGFLLTFWSVYHFLKVKGTPVPANPPPVLVTSGPYAYSRNPMLTGVFLLLFGIGFLIENFSLVVIFTPLFILFNTLELKNIEEPELEKRLGISYSEYKKITPMYIPKLRRSFKSDSLKN